MKGRKILKGMFVMLLILAVMALPRQVFATDNHEEPQPSIKILKVKTFNNEREPQTEFNLWHPVLFGIKYEITGEADTRYKVVGMVKAAGKIIVVRQKRYPGVHRMVTALLVPGHVRPGEKTVKYKVKLRKAGKLLDKDTATSEITILTPNPKLGYLRLVEKDPGDWSVVEGGARGLLRYTRIGPMFIFHFDGHGLIPNTSYTLIYYPDPWPGNGLICLSSDTTDYHGCLRNLVGAVKIDGGLPAEYDENHPDGAKIWLVRSEDVDCNGKMMVGWNPKEYLFEHELITYPDTEGNVDAVHEEIAPVNAAIKIYPGTLNLKRMGKWGLACQIKLPKGYSIKDIDVNTILLQAEEWITVSRSRARGNGLMVKFDRDDVKNLIEGMVLEYPAEVELHVTGQLYDDTQFEGSDTIRVINGRRSRRP